MKILHLSSQYPSKTGSGIYLSEVYKNLRRLGYTQKVLCSMNSDDIVDTIFDDVEILKFKSDKLKFPVVGMSDIMPYESFLFRDLKDNLLEEYISCFREKIIEVYNDFKPDIIFTNHLYIMSSIVGSLNLDCKVYGFCHGTCLRQLYKNDVHRDIVKEGIKNLDGIFSLSHLQKEEIVEVFSFDRDRIYVIGGGYDSEYYYRKEYHRLNREDELRIIYAGKFSKAKGVIYLLKAFERIKDKYNVKLVIAGSGTGVEVEEILSYAQNLGESVEVLGYMSMKDISDLFRTCHIFAMPSLYEGLSLVTIEAMACGLNVVVNKLDNLLNFVGKTVSETSYMEIVDLPELVDTDKIRHKDEEKHILNWERHLEKQILNTYNNEFISDKVYARISSLSWNSIVNNIVDYIK